MLRKATSNDSVFLVLLKNFKGLKKGDQVFYRPNLEKCYVLGKITNINSNTGSINIDNYRKNIHAKSGNILMLTNEFDQESHDKPRFADLTNTNSMGASKSNYQIKVDRSDIDTTHLVITNKIEKNGKQYFKENQHNEYVLFEEKKIKTSSARTVETKRTYETTLILVNGDVFNQNFIDNKNKNLSLFEVIS